MMYYSLLLVKKDTKYGDIVCCQCRRQFMHNDIKWYPMKTQFFSKQNFKRMKRAVDDKRCIDSLADKKKEMEQIQKRLRSDEYDSVMDDLVKRINNSCDDHKSKKYKINMLNVSRKIRSHLDEDVKKYADNFAMYPGLIFGCYEFPYVGKCPTCRFEITTVWLGHESLKRSVKIKDKNQNDKSTFRCESCGIELIAEHNIWIVVRESEYEDEFLETVCQECHVPQVYPYDFTWMPLIVESGGPHTNLKYQMLPEWMLPRPTSYEYDEDVGLIDTQAYTVTKNKIIADEISYILKMLRQRYIDS